MGARALFKKTQIAALAAAFVATAVYAVDGSFDEGFSGDGKVQVAYEGTKSENFSAASVLADSTDILTAGFVSSTLGERRLFIARLSEIGSIVSQQTANDLPLGSLSGITVTRAGEIVVAGSNETGSAGDRASSAIFAKYNEAGAEVARNSFPSTPAEDNSVYCSGNPLAEPNGDFVVPCGVIQADGVMRPALLRLNNDLSLDTESFGGDGIALGSSLNNTNTIDNPNAGDAMGLAVTRDGAGGYYLLARDQSVADPTQARDVLYVQRFNAAGELDQDFGENGVATVYTVAAPQQAGDPDGGLEGLSIHRGRDDGKIYVGGRHFQFGENGFFRAFIARLNPDGSVDDSFNSGVDENNTGVIETAEFGSGVMRIAQDGSNRIYMLTTNFVVRLSDNGAADPTFPHGGTEVNTLNRGDIDCDGVAPDNDACYTSEWKGLLMMPEEHDVLLLGGTAGYVANSNSPSQENAIVVKVRADASEVDTTPDEFTFPAKSNQPLNSTVKSDPVTITGLNSPAPIAISGGTAAMYSIGCDDNNFTSDAGTITNGETVCVRMTSASTPNTESASTLTIGGIANEFKATTGAGGGGGGGEQPRRSGGGGGALDWLLLALGAPALLRRKTKR